MSSLCAVVRRWQCSSTVVVIVATDTLLSLVRARPRNIILTSCPDTLHNLRYPSLAHAHLGPAGAQLLSQGLKGSKRLTSLKCVPCPDFSPLYHALAIEASQISNSASTSLANNDFGPEGGSAVAKMLATNVALVALKSVQDLSFFVTVPSMAANVQIVPQLF